MTIEPSASLHLKADRDRSLKRGHPWILSGAVAKVDGDSYITAGIDQPITGAFSVYAEYQLEQNVSSSEKDQNNYAIGTKIVF